MRWRSNDSRRGVNFSRGARAQYLAIAILAIGCGGVDNAAILAPQPPGRSEEGIRPESTLVDHCYSWPDVEFDVVNRAEIGTSVTEGEKAIEFTLTGTDGRAYSLSDLLETRPVLLVLGGYT